MHLIMEIRFKVNEKDESLVICGGGFPLIIRGELRGSILVSGLVHDEDHQVIVDCLRKLKLFEFLFDLRFSYILKGMYFLHYKR